MFLVTAEEMREIDRMTIEEVGIPGVVLMENAGAQVAKEIMSVSDKNHGEILILTGHGNNGGDGFVIARHLGNNGYDVETWMIGDINKLSDDSSTNFHSLVHSGFKVKFWSEQNQQNLFKKIENATVIVDAILGTGVKGALREPVRSIVQYINQSKAKKVAVDMPTGVNTDTGEVVDVAFKADVTVTFALPKIGQLLYPGAEYIGKLVVSDISIPPIVIDGFKVKRQLVDETFVRGLLPERKLYSHKGTYGHALIIGGSKNMPGAPTLSSLAALRSGPGLTTTVVPESVQGMVFSRIPEAICIGAPEDATGHFSLKSVDLLNIAEGKYTAIGVGPGVGVWDQGREWLLQILQSTTLPVVIDADGLNLLAEDLSPIKDRKGVTILTPHPGEMARLLKKDVKYVEQNRIKAALNISTTYGVYLVLKGFHTIISTPEGEILLNSTGGPELAKGGSGDVLTGMLVGFLAQRLPVKNALALSVYLHGLAGYYASFPSNYSTTATDVIDKISLAIHNTMSNHA